MMFFARVERTAAITLPQYCNSDSVLPLARILFDCCRLGAVANLSKSDSSNLDPGALINPGAWICEIP